MEDETKDKINQILNVLEENSMATMQPHRVMFRLREQWRKLLEIHGDLSQSYTDEDRLRAKELRDAINFYGNIYTNPVSGFWETLKTNSVKWSEVLRSDYGVKRLEFSQTLLMNLAASYKLEKFWFALKNKLPGDAVLVDIGDGLIHYKASLGAFDDTMFCFFASAIWRKNKEGEEIPLLEITFTEGEI